MVHFGFGFALSNTFLLHGEAALYRLHLRNGGRLIWTKMGKNFFLQLTVVLYISGIEPETTGLPAQRSNCSAKGDITNN